MALSDLSSGTVSAAFARPLVYCGGILVRLAARQRYETKRIGTIRLTRSIMCRLPKAICVIPYAKNTEYTRAMRIISRRVYRGSRAALSAEFPARNIIQPNSAAPAKTATIIAANIFNSATTRVPSPSTLVRVCSRIYIGSYFFLLSSSPLIIFSCRAAALPPRN